MSIVISKEDDLKNTAYIYMMLYGSDIRIKPIADKPYMALAIENGDFDVTGIVEGNTFNEAVAITIQRYLVQLYTPLSDDGLTGSNFLSLVRSLDGVDTQSKIKILKAELLLVGLKIPQIKTIRNINHKILDAYTLSFEVNFELITGEYSDFMITGVV